LEDFNSYFTKLRKSQGLTQEQFAQKLGISRSLVAKIEANKQDVTKKVKEKLHNVFPGSVFFTQNPDNIPAQKPEKNIPEWTSESIVNKNHYIFKVLDVYLKDIESISYYDDKINYSIKILHNLKAEKSNFEKLKQFLDKNLLDLKDTYGYFLIGSISREELITNKDFLQTAQREKLEIILNSKSQEQLDKVSNDLIMLSKNLLELFKKSFDDIFEYLYKYSQCIEFIR